MTEPGDRGRPTLPEAMDAGAIFGASGGPMPVLVVLTGPQVGQRIRLEQPAVIGRDPECDLMLFDESVDWHHARVEERQEGWTVVDLTGEQRTEVNGMRVSSLALSPDDQLILGHTVVRFELHDPVEQAYDEAVLERLNKDELTGLLARRKFDIELRSAVAAAGRRGEQLALVLVDVDRLKAINDAHGHLVGAQVIADVGVLVGEHTDERSLACRLGGDEFAVALPGIDAPAALRWANALRADAARRSFEHEGEPLVVRVSGGVAAFPADGSTPLELLRRADEALYRAKDAGGDRVFRWQEPREPTL